MLLGRTGGQAREEEGEEVRRKDVWLSYCVSYRYGSLRYLNFTLRNDMYLVMVMVIRWGQISGSLSLALMVFYLVRGFS